MRFGRLLFFGACSNRIRPGAQQRTRGCSYCARCRAPAHLIPPLEMGKGVSALVRFTIHTPYRATVRFPPPSVVPLHVIHVSLFLTGDADLVALPSTPYTRSKDISRHVVPAFHSDAPFVGRTGPPENLHADRRCETRAIVTPYYWLNCFSLVLYSDIPRVSCVHIHANMGTCVRGTR